MLDSSPVDDAQVDRALVAADKRPFPTHWIALGLLVIANTAFGAYFNPNGKNSNGVGEEVYFVILGFFLAQPILFALWAAFAPQRFYQRFLWAFLLCSLVAFTEELGTLWDTQADHASQIVTLLIFFIMFTSVLLLVRRFFGWRFRRSQMEFFPGDYRANQFGIKHLILLMTITGIAFALIRSLMIFNSSNRLPSVEEFISIALITCLVFAMLIPIIIVPWFTMTSRGNTIKLIVFATVLLGIIDSAIFLIALKADAKHINNNLRAMFFSQLGAYLTVLLNTIVLRLCGYRLIRERKSLALFQTHRQ